MVVPHRLNLGKLKSFTVRNPGKNTRQSPFLHSFEVTLKVFGKRVVETGAGIITNNMPLDLYVPLKGKLTVTRESKNSTRDWIVDPRKFRESSLESSSVTRELALSSFESRKIMSLLVD